MWLDKSEVNYTGLKSCENQTNYLNCAQIVVDWKLPQIIHMATFRVEAGNITRVAFLLTIPFNSDICSLTSFLDDITNQTNASTRPRPSENYLNCLTERQPMGGRERHKDPTFSLRTNKEKGRNTKFKQRKEENKSVPFPLKGGHFDCSFAMWNRLQENAPRGLQCE